MPQGGIIEFLGSSDITNNHSQVILVGDYGWYQQWLGNRSPQDMEQLTWHLKDNYYNALFLDGHVGFKRIYTDYYITEDYAVLPFKELNQLADDYQQGLPPLGQ